MGYTAGGVTSTPCAGSEVFDGHGETSVRGGLNWGPGSVGDCTKDSNNQSKRTTS